MPRLFEDNKLYDFFVTKKTTSASDPPDIGSGHIERFLTASATLDFPNTNAQLSSDLTISVPGAALGDIVILGVPNGSVNANTCYTAWVSAANTVSIRFNNYSAGAVNPASGAFNVAVLGLSVA